MKITETVTDIASLLGGPQISAEDIDWALDVPAGQRLLDWLVSQVEGETVTDGPDQLRAALQAISLEENEVEMLRHATKKAATAVHRPATEPKLPSGYITPWRLRAKEEYTVAEAVRLEAETESLKSRLQQTKIASQSLTQAFKILASEIEKTESNIQTAEDGLSELSLQADAAILGSVNSSLGLVDGCSHDSTEDESSLSAVSSARTARTNHIHSQIRAIDAAARNLPTPAELQAECARLDIALRAVGADPALDREIVRLCTALEDPETSKDVLATVLAAKTGHRVQRPSLDVAAELEAVWARDQADLLDARGAVLDEAIAAFSETILPPLAALHNNLSARNAHMGEAQALIGALREEIQDIVENVGVAQKPQEKPSVPSPEESKDMELQAGLTSLLKQLKDARPRDASPLVLLSPEDILSELRDVYQREEVSRGQEEEWVANLLPTLRNLETAHAPLLDAVYAYSSLNSSAPFSVPAHIQTVHANAKSKADDLGDAISKLQEDVKTLTNDRAKRRMEQFVSKWAK